MEACKKDLSDDFILEGYEVDKRYNVLIPTFKMRYKDSYQKEANWFWLPNKCKTGSGFFVDICAFMGVPENEEEHRKTLKKAKHSYVPYVFLDALLRINPYGMKKRLKEYERQIAEKYRNSSRVSQTVIIPWQDMSKLAHENSFPREVIYPFREFDFCGHKVFSFNDPEQFVKLRYGPGCLKQLKDGVWVDPFPKNARAVGHTRKYLLTLKK